MNRDEDSSWSMEQGVRLTGCPVCQVLYPELPGTCPACGGRMQFVEAQMMSAELIAERVRQDVHHYLQAPPDAAAQRQALKGLLRTLHIYRPAAVAALGDTEVDLERLRRHHESLSGD